MTLLDEPPAMTTSSPTAEPVTRSAVPTWRVAGRLARREVRRRPGRTVLAALLIAVPVMAMTLGSVLARTNASDWSADFQRDYGDADLVIGGSQWYVPAVSEADDRMLSDVADGPDVPGGGVVLGQYMTAQTTITPTDPRPGVWYSANFTNIDLADPAEAVGVELTDGRVPGAGEVALDADLADALGVGIGDTLELERPSGAWEVAGFVRMRGNYWQNLMVVPDFDLDRIVPDQRSTTTLVKLPAETSVGEIRQIAAARGAFTRYDAPYVAPDQLATGMAWGYVAGVLALVAVGIIVAAAFATSARRQLVTIGQLSSNGASEPVVRRTLALQGTWTGAVGAAMGMLAGLAALPIARPIVAEHLARHELRAFRFSILDLVVIAVTAIVAATVAAGVPARSAAKVPVMTALAGRRPAGAPPKWLVPTGLVLFSGGLGLIAIAALGAAGASGSDNVWAAIVVLGATAMVFGTCCASPLVVERVGRLGRRASLSWRVALRSLARSRTRSAAVVAAIAVAAGGAVAVAAIAESAVRSNAQCCPPSLPADAAVVNVYAAGYDTPGGDLVDLGPLADVELPQSILDGVSSLGPGARVEPLLQATFDPAPFNPVDDYNDGAGPMIATEALLDLIQLSDADAELLTERGAVMPSYGAVNGGFVYEFGDLSPVSAIDYRSEDGVVTVEFGQSGESSRYAFEGSLLMTEEAARSAGFDLVQRGLVIRTPDALTRTQLDTLARLQQQGYGTPADAFVEPGDPPRTVETAQTGLLDGSFVNIQYDDPAWRSASDHDVWLARLVIVAGALVLSLLVVSIGLALAAAEGREERDTFAVVGAKPATMRRQSATRAVVMAGVGILLGIPLGFSPVWLVDRITNQRFDPYRVPVGFPWVVVATLLVVIPLVAASGAWTGSALAQRFRPASPTRRD